MFSDLLIDNFFIELDLTRLCLNQLNCESVSILDSIVKYNAHRYHRSGILFYILKLKHVRFDSA